MEMTENALRDRWDAEEQELMRQIQTYEACTMAILNMVNGQLTSLHKLAVEDIVSTLHRVALDLQTELLYVRLEKALCLPQVVVSGNR
ncbi:hypothetical protein SAMN04487970_10943 [Paenibacillus tianmuensis]|uniref:Uncharacterized protein n=1 Tax=Paenibacillus tianmuensis TaxID=624147 RepID=A0A1G4U1Q4_9BACL|nr:hypothetical protein [Paenibacillus tianmuensis]SCW87487.1 hypothetical protein SAMN04487970_10943 [Paenibacillus tianmuensis]